jgi:hypothetical protein
LGTSPSANITLMLLQTRKLVSDDFGRGFLLLLQFIHRCEKVKMISEQT